MPNLKLLTIQEAARFFKVTEKTLRRWEEKGYLIPIRTSGGHRRYQTSQIIEFKKNRKAIERKANSNISVLPTPTISETSFESTILPHVTKMIDTELIAKSTTFKETRKSKSRLTLSDIKAKLAAFKFAYAFVGISLLIVILFVATKVIGKSNSAFPTSLTKILAFKANKSMQNDNLSNIDILKKQVDGDYSLPQVLAATSFNNLRFKVNVESNFSENVDIGGVLNLSGNGLKSSGDLVIDPGGGGVSIGTGTPSNVALENDDFFVSGSIESAADIYAVNETLTRNLNVAGVATVGSLTLNAENFTDLTGTGLSDVSGVLTTTLGTSIDGTEITDNTINEIDLNTTNSPTNAYVLTYDSATGGFTWAVDQTGVANTIWTDDGATTYLTSTTDDLALGGTDGTAGFFFEAATGNLSISGDLSGSAGSFTGAVNASSLSTTSGGVNITSGQDLTIGSTGLNDVGVSNTTSGAFLVGVFDEFTNSNGTNLQAVLNDFDAAMGSGASKWTQDTGFIYLTNSTDSVTIGGNTELGKLAVDGDTDQVQLLIQGNATQTSNLVVFENSTGTDLLTLTNAGNLTISGSATVNGDTISDFTGNGLQLSGSSLTLQTLSSSDGLSSTTSNGSGLEVLPTGIGLLQGCADGELLKWNETNDSWECATDSGATSAVVGVENNDVAIGVSVDTLDFSTDFSVVASPSNEANISIADDILNFTELSEALTLDAATTITNSLAGNLTIDLTSTGDFVISDAGTPFFTFTDAGALTQSGAGQVTFTGNVDATNGLDVSNTSLTVGGANFTVSSSTGDVTTAGDIFVNGGNLSLGINGQDGSLTIYSEQGASDFSTIFQPGTQTQNITYTLPPDDGSGNYVLTTDGSGVLQWSSVTGIPGAGDITAVGNVLTGAAFTNGGASGSSLYFYDTTSTNYGQLALNASTLSGPRTYTLPDASGELSVLGQTIEGSEITDDTIKETDLNVTNSPTNSFLLTYDSGTGGFSWIDPSTAGTNYWQRVSGILSPVNLNDGIAATSSATTVGTLTSTGTNDALRAGSASNYVTISSLGNLSFNGSAANIDKVSGTFNLNTVNNQAITTGTGQITLAGNVDATNGLDVTTANLTVGGANFSVAQASGNIITAGTLAVNGDAITSDGATLTINAAGNVDIQDSLNVDSLTTDIGGVTITSGQDLTIGAIGLNDIGVSNITSGASLVGVFDEFTNSNSTTVQDVLDDLDAAMGAGASKWTQNTGYIYLTNTTDSVTIGGTTELGKLAIDGDSDEIQLLVQGNATQNANLATFENSAGSDLLQISNFGDVLAGFTALNGSSTTNGATSSKNITLTDASNFDIGNYIQLASTSCESGVNTCYAKIVGKSTNILTLDHSLTWANGATVTEYHIPEVGGNDLTQTATNRYGRGYFLAGVVTGSGSTTYTDQAIFTSDVTGTNSPSLSITTGATSTSGNSGNITIDVGAAAGTAGTINIGGTNATTLNIGRSGQAVTFTGNVDATSGIDITGSDLTVGGANFSVSQSTGDITTAGDLFVNGGSATLGTNGQDGSLTIYSEQGATDYTTIFQPGTQSANITYTLPNDDGTNNYVLTTDGNGVLAWSSVTGIPGSGDITSVGNVTSGAAFTAGSGQGTSLSFFDAQGEGLLTIADLTGAQTYTLPNATGEISVLGQTIEGNEIADNTIEETDLEVTNAGTDNYILTFDSATGGFTWVDPATAGTNYWDRIAGILSPQTLNDGIAATSSATTVATLTSTGSNDALKAGSTGSYLTVSSNGDLSIPSTRTITIGGDSIDEFVGTGLQLSSGDLQTTLGTAIDTTEITDGTITGDDINSNIAGNGLVLTAGSPDTLDIQTGNGIQITADAVALGPLTANWNQTAAFDIVLNNAGSELTILESDGGSSTGTIDVGSLSGDTVYTFVGATGNVLTSSNAATQLSGWDQNASNDVTTFLGLTDTPSSYTGQGTKVVRVNSGETALEFVDPATLGTNYWALNNGVLSPTNGGVVIAATSAATTVGTLTSTGSNDALRAGGASNYASVNSNGSLVFNGVTTDITTATGENLVLSAGGGGTVDIQDQLTVDSLVTDLGGITILAGQSIIPSASGALTIGNSNLTGLTVTTTSTGDSSVVLPNDSISSAEILDNTVTTSDLAATLTFIDGDLINLSSVNVSGTGEGLILPQNTSCSSGIAEGQICWDSDTEALYVGTGSGIQLIGGSGGGDITAVGNIATGDAFTSGTPGLELYFATSGFLGLGSSAGNISFTDSGTDVIDINNANLDVNANTLVGSTATIDFSEFDVSGTTGSVTINDGGDLGQVSIEGTILDIDSLTFAGAGSVLTAGATSLTIDAGGAASLNLGNTNANAITLGRTGITTTNPGAFTVTQTLTANGAVSFTPSSTSGVTLNLDTDSLFTLDSSVTNGDNIVISPNNTGTGSTFTGTITSANLTGNQTYTFPDATGDVCLTTGNCVGVGGAGDISGTGTTGQISYFTGTKAIASETTGFAWDATNNKLGINDDTPEGIVDIEGAAVGKALLQLNETGDQNILTASASGTTVMNLDRSGNLSLLSQGDLRLYDTDNSNYSGFQANGNTTQNSVYTLPAAYPGGSAYLKSDTSGNLSFDISTYDNYSSWTFAVGGVSQDPITSGDVLDFVSGAGITVSRSADDQLTFTATDTSSTNELQNLWSTFTAENASTTTANSQTDNLTINGTGNDTTITGDTLSVNFDSTELNDLTWGTGANSTITWSTNLSGATDPTIIFGNDRISLSGDLTVTGGDITLNTAGSIIPSASGTITIGNSNLTGLTVTTTGTGDSTVVLPSGAISGTEILDDTIKEVDLNVTNSPSASNVLTYDSGSGGFTWVDSASLGTNYWSKIAGVLSPSLSEPIAATSSATTVATFTQGAGSNTLALKAGGATNFMTVDIDGDIVTAGDLAVNGGDITSSSNLTINSGGNLIIADATIDLTTQATNIDLINSNTSALTFESSLLRLDTSNTSVEVSGTTNLGDGGTTNYAQFNATGDLTFNGTGDTITGPGAGGLTISNTSGNLTLTTATAGDVIVGPDVSLGTGDDLFFQDGTMTASVPLTVADTALNVNLTQGIIDSINDLYDEVSGAGATAPWKYVGNLIYSRNATDDLAIGGSSLASSMFSIDESLGTFLFDGDNSVNPILRFEATDSDTADLTFNTNDTLQLSGGIFQVNSGTANADNINIQGNSTGASTFTGTITSANLTGNQTYTLPDATGDFCLTSGNCVGVGGAGDISGNGTAGQISYFTGTKAIASEATGFAWDATNNKLGINDDTPEGIVDIEGASVGQALLQLNETGNQNILTASASGTTVANLDRSGNLSVEGYIEDLSGGVLSVNDDLKVTGNDIIDSGDTTRITLGATTTLTNTTTTLSGTSTLNGTSVTAINLGAATIDFNGAGVLQYGDGSNFTIADDGTHNILKLTGSSNLLEFGNATDNNAFTFLGTGLTTLGGDLTVSGGDATLGLNGTDGTLTIYSEQGATDYTTIFQPGTQTQNITYTLPPDDGTLNYVLTTNGSGALTWASVSGIGGGTMSSFTLSGDGGSDQTISDGNTLEVAGGAGITTTGTATDTISLAFNSTELNDLTWGDSSQASYTWTTALSGGADPTLTFANGGITTNGDLVVQGGDITLNLSGSIIPSGSGTIKIGNVNMTGLNVVTTGTGDTTVSLPTGAISGTEILDDTIKEVDLNVTNSPSASNVLTYDSGSAGFTWADSSTLGVNYWSKISGVLSPTLSEPLAASSAATTVATFTSTGTNAAMLLDASGSGTIADLLLLTQSGSGTITDAIDVSDETITNALNLGSNTILGTTAVIDFTNYDLASTGLMTLVGGLSPDITTQSGNNLTLLANGAGQIILNDTVQLKSGTPATNGVAYSSDANGTIAYTATGGAGSLCLISASGAAPSFTTCPGGGTNYWQLSGDSKGLLPYNTTLDVMVGANATASATLVAKALETTTGNILDINSSVITTGLVADISASALTSGSGLKITGSGATMTTGGELIDLALGANTVGAGMTITSTGAYTGVGTADGLLNITANSLTSGYASQIFANALTSGTELNLSSSSTAITTGTTIANGGASMGSLLNIGATGVLTAFTGNLATIDWSPTSAATSTTGDLLHLNIGTNGNLRNLLNITDANSTLFSVAENQITSAIPQQFTAAGDVAVAYDLIFTNQTATNIDSYGPLNIRGGESFESNNLTLTSYLSGNILLNTGATAGKVGIGAGITPLGLLTVDSTGTGLTGKATLTVIQDESQDIITASASATTRFKVNSAGNTFVTLRNTDVNALCHPTNGAGFDEITDCAGSVSADYAEMYPIAEGATFGDIVSVGSDNVITTAGSTIKKLVKSTAPYQNNVIGIVSDNFGDFTSAGYNINSNDNPLPVALSGRVPVKVASNSQSIHAGDYVTTSAEAGRAMKAQDTGRVVGTALEDWTPNNGKETVMVYVNNTFYMANNPLNGNGDIRLVDDVENSGYKKLTDANGNVIDKISGIVGLIADNIKAGYVEVNSLVSNSIKTKEIAPIDNEKDLTIKIGTNGQGLATSDQQTGFGKLLIKNSQDQVVAEVDESGNASFSGQLTADTVVASNLMSRDEIEGLINSVELDQQALIESQNWNTNTATGSATLNELALENLYVTGQAAFKTLSLTESLVIGNDLAISQQSSMLNGQLSMVNSIDTLNAPLSIQSSASQPLYIMAGLVQVDTLGNVQIAGDLTVGGSIDAKSLTLTPDTENLTGFGKLLSIKDSLGGEVAGITATGAAEFKSVITDVLAITDDPTATSSATFTGVIYTTTASAGEAKIPAGSSEIIIKNPNINSGSLVFTTATSSTIQNIYIKNKIEGQATIGFDLPASADTTFNWWIVELSKQANNQ